MRPAPHKGRSGTLLAGLAGFALLCLPAAAHAEPAAKAAAPAPPVEAVSPPPSAADAIAEAFSSVGNELTEDCIFDLSEEQIEVQAALVLAYMEQGADGTAARKLAAAQIQPPKLSKKCEQLRSSPPKVSAAAPPEAAPEAPAETVTESSNEAAAPILPETAEPAPPEPAELTSPGWDITVSVSKAPDKTAALQPAALPAPKPAAPKPAAQQPAAEQPATPKLAAKQPTAQKPAQSVALADKKVLPQWDCAPNVDYVTVQINGYPRKLTGGEICNPYEDVVREVPDSLRSFRLGYTIETGRLFVVPDGAGGTGQTIAWAISGRDVCRNNPDPDCLAARAIGSLPPGEYAFAGKAHRINYGPKTKRNVAAVYLKKLWNKDRFTPQQKAGMLARRNIAIHARLKGEMSEACIGLEPKGWTYVSALIKDGRATALNVYLSEPYPQVAEKPPLVEGSSFSLISLFK